MPRVEFRLESDRQDRYTPSPGQIPEDGIVYCGVCGERMNVSRGYSGALSLAGAMGGVRSNYDLFECPHIDESWHRQVKRLRNAAEDTPSAVLADMLLKEAEQILKTRTCTKEDYGARWG